MLQQLILNNFKGIRTKDITFSKQTDIFGANETGKSTLYTAFIWLITGKDEQDREDYQIKNTNQKELNELPHEVTGFIMVNSESIKLKRVYKEKWQREKGQKGKTFKGHTTDYYWNDVPLSATEYQAKINDIIHPSNVRLLTNVSYFNQMHWEKQRNVLMTIAGNITNDEVFEELATPEDDYATLIFVLNSGKTIDEYKKELAAKKVLLKKKLSSYETRIDEAKRNQPEAKDWAGLQANLDKREEDITKLDAALNDASIALQQASTNYSVKTKELNQLHFKLEDIRNKTRNELFQRINKVENDIQATENLISQCNLKISNLQNASANNGRFIDNYNKRLQDNNEQIIALRKEWKEINATAFVLNDADTICPTCHQPLPEGDFEAKKETMLKHFNDDKQKKLNLLVSRSNEIKTANVEWQKNIDNLSADNSKEIEALTNEKEAAKFKLIELKKAAAANNNHDETEIKVEALLKLNGDAMNLVDDIKQVQSEIESLKLQENGTMKNDVMVIERDSIRSVINSLRKELAMKQVVEETDKRIKELKDEESQTAQEIADIENHEFQADEYMKVKMDILEKKVNGLFKYVHFRLFDKQVNGQTIEACICEYKQVPFPTLNTAAKILAGVDIINTLSDYYQTYLPVFIDNRESVTFLPESKSQIISLYVSDADKNLRIQNV